MRANTLIFFAINATFYNEIRIIRCTNTETEMKTYKSNLPQITLKLKKGEVLNCKISNSKDCSDLFRKIWDTDSLLVCETMICIFLNRQNNTIGWFKVSQGGLSGTVIDVRLILATALNCLASAIILAHNHPSGNLHPSEADISMTKKLREASNYMDIQILDHIILTEEDFYSLADNGLM
jgi:DNA repair protein RadC